MVWTEVSPFLVAQKDDISYSCLTISIDHVTRKSATTSRVFISLRPPKPAEACRKKLLLCSALGLFHSFLIGLLGTGRAGEVEQDIHWLDT
jgi:hypothetical protein